MKVKTTPFATNSLPVDVVAARRRARDAALLLLGVALVGVVTAIAPTLALLGSLTLGICVLVYLHPPTAAYLLLAATPLLAGMDRGLVIPVLRPNEAIDALVGGALFGRGLLWLTREQMRRFRLSRFDVALLVLAVASSVLPVGWMILRGRSFEANDITYSLMLWKYVAVYAIVRTSVVTEGQIRACIWISMVVAAVVAMVGVLQALNLFGVPGLLASHYSAYGNVVALENNRGSSTLSLPIAVADLMILNLGLAMGALIRGWRPRLPLMGLAAIFVIGVLAAGEFSGAIGLVIGGITIAVINRRGRQALGLFTVIGGGLFLLRPVVERRLSAFHTVGGMPQSWLGRLHNLRSYFWPDLFSHYHWIMGVRPSAVVAVSSQATGFVWIESGYTWLLWAGGLPFLGAFFYFLASGLRMTVRAAQKDRGPAGVAALACAVALVMIGILMVLDPHLTYRGSADLLFALLALAAKSPLADGGGSAVAAPAWTGTTRIRPSGTAVQPAAARNAR
jgi:hypothetical protein